MAGNSRGYNLFYEFKNAYESVGFRDIDRHDPLLLAIEEILNNNNQFLIIFDVLNMKNVFVSMGSIQMMGIEPDNLTPYHFKEATHPDDLIRHELALAKLFKVGHEIYVEKEGEMVMSTNFRFRNPGGNFTNTLIQCYFFYCPAPWDTVFLLHLFTDISWSKKFKHGFHYYVGNDISYFRYPDEELLEIGNIFSQREFEIIRLIKSGFESEQIAQKLFLSKHTVNTHRKNILNKTGKAHISDLIYDLTEQGLI